MGREGKRREERGERGRVGKVERGEGERYGLEKWLGRGQEGVR